MKTDKTINPFELKPCQFFAMWHGLDMPEYEECSVICERMIEDLLDEKFAGERKALPFGRRPVPALFPRQFNNIREQELENRKNETRR
jgi:hypothetical protein